MRHPVKKNKLLKPLKFIPEEAYPFHLKVVWNLHFTAWSDTGNYHNISGILLRRHRDQASTQRVIYNIVQYLNKYLRFCVCFKTRNLNNTPVIFEAKSFQDFRSKALKQNKVRKRTGALITIGDSCLNKNRFQLTRHQAYNQFDFKATDNKMWKVTG